jgi:hypothetical protein
LCSPQELALVASARGEELKALTPKRLLTKVTRARGLRDKFRDLARRQAREGRGKAPPRKLQPAQGNARTVEKAELFGEVLRRFEARAAKVDPPRVATARPVRARSPRVPRPTRSKRRQSQAASAARKQRKLATSQVSRVQAHVSSRNRRGQARRDSR